MKCREQKRRSLMRQEILSAWIDAVNPSLSSSSGKSPIIDSTSSDKDTTWLPHSRHLSNFSLLTSARKSDCPRNRRYFLARCSGIRIQRLILRVSKTNVENLGFQMYWVTRKVRSNLNFDSIYIY
jgi:hypothetical protein